MPKEPRPNLICVATVTRRSTDTQIQSTHQLAIAFDNEFARRQVEQKTLEELATGAYPGALGAQANYENAKHELLRLKNWPPDPVQVEAVIEQAYNAGLTMGARAAVKDTAPFIWRTATELDL